MKTYRLFLVFVLVLSIVSSLFSQKKSINPENFIKDVQAKYSSFNNFVIDFFQEVSSSAVEDKQILNGKLHYQKPNRYRLEINNQIIVCDGENVYNYSRKAKRVVITKFEENFFSPQNLLVEIPKYSKIDFIGEEIIENKNLLKFSLSPSRSNPEFKSMFLWIDDNRTIWKIQTEDWAGNIYNFSVQKFLVNQSFKSDFFKFKVPAGVKVIDLR